jgi:hypothetical protein
MRIADETDEPSINEQMNTAYDCQLDRVDRALLARAAANHTAPTREWVEEHFGAEPPNFRFNTDDEAKQELAEKYDARFRETEHFDSIDEAGEVNQFGAVYFLEDGSLVLVTTDLKVHHYPND